MDYDYFWLVIVLISSLGVFIVIFGTLRYRQALNPLTQFAIFDVGILTLLSAIIGHINYAGDLDFSPVLCISLIYITGFLSAFVPSRLKFPSLIFSKISSVLSARANLAQYSFINQASLIVVAFAIFGLLISASGSWLLWLVDPRSAYQNTRGGVGFLYLFFSWSLVSAYLYYLLSARPSVAGWLIATTLYVILAVFTGSKSNILSGFVLAMAVYNFYIKRIPSIIVFISFFGAILVFLIANILQGSAQDLYESLIYFKDYSETTALFLSRSSEFDFQWGYGHLSSLWYYVPRALYQDKPYEYGVLLIHKILFPGSAELGATPGVANWALSYLDFGYFGVFVFGIVDGLIRRGAYESFFANKGSILSFLLMMQFGLFPVIQGGSLVIIIALGTLLGLIYARRLVYGR